MVAGEKGGGRTPATRYAQYDRELAYGDRSVCSMPVFHGDMTDFGDLFPENVENDCFLSFLLYICSEQSKNIYGLTN